MRPRSGLDGAVNTARTENSPEVTRYGNLSPLDILEEMQEEASRAERRDPREALVTTRAVSIPNASGVAELAALLRPNDSAFIEQAFQVLLHRTPEPLALTRYVDALATGRRSKLEILGELRYSREGRKIGTAIPGLFSRYILLRSYRLPGLGSVLHRLVDAVTWRDHLRRSHAEMASTIAALRSTVDGLHGTLANTDRRFQRHDTDIALALQDRPRLREVETKLSTLSMDNWAEPLIALAARMDHQVRLMRELEARSDDIVAVASVLRALRAEYGWADEEPGIFAERLAAISRDIVRRAIQADATAQRSRAEVLDQSRRLGLLMTDVRKRLDQPLSTEEIRGLDEADAHRLDALYVAFEDRFRGNRWEIRERQRAHLPLLRAAQAGREDRPIVDVGCGRGEWLELLREEGLRATGVDLNHTMIELCRNMNLDCVQDDAVGYLRRVADNSLGAVTGFHIIEHLPFEVFVALLDESLRVLKSEGLILFETPNPANLLVSSNRFYLDPTHRNPMPAELTTMIAEARGFVGVEVRELHPMPVRFQGRDEVLLAQLDPIFHGPQDYALIARKA